MNSKCGYWIHGVTLLMVCGMSSLWYHEKADGQALFLALGLLLVIYGGYYGLVKLIGDRALLFIPIGFLLAVSYLMLLRLNPLWSEKQCCWIILGVGVMLLATAVIQRVPKQRVLNAQYIWFVITAILLIIPLLFGVEKGGATSWLTIGILTFQPSELAKVTFLLFMVSWYKKNGQRSLRALMILAGGVGCLLLLLVAQIDLGGAVIFYSIFIIVMYLSTGRRAWAIGGLLVLLVLGAVAYACFDHVQIRVETWLDPWVTVETGGYQLVQSLVAFAAGGWFGTGLGLGKPYMIPAAHTDFIFAVVGEQLGFVGCVFVIGAYLWFLQMACTNLIRIRTRGSFLLASGLVFFILAQSMIILGGVTKLIPLTGVTLPFLSYGGSSMVTNLGALGLILGLSKDWGRVVGIQKKKIHRIQLASQMVYGLILVNLFYWQIIQGQAVLAKALALL